MIENLMKVMNIRMNLSGVLTVIHIRREVSARTEIFFKEFRKDSKYQFKVTTYFSSFELLKGF